MSLVVFLWGAFEYATPQGSEAYNTATTRAAQHTSHNFLDCGGSRRFVEIRRWANQNTFEQQRAHNTISTL